MRILIAVDMEGIAGVCLPELVERGTLLPVDPADPYRKRIDGRTIEVSADRVRTAFDRLR